jgi:AAA15 family ATPase/GTPase
MFVSGSNDFLKKVLEKCKETNDTYIDKTSDFIRNFDIDISKIQPTTKKFHISDIRLPVKVINQLDKMDKARQKEFGYDAQEHSVTINTVDVYHKDINNEEVIFDFLKNESKGTQILFGLMYLILRELDAGRTLIIDEIDRSIHPLVFAKIIELFKDKEYNTKNAQLIFTTHCTDILEMDILRISEVATINKTISNGSTITRISDFKYSGNFKNIRNTTDFRKLYLQGAFSGIPFPHI